MNLFVSLYIVYLLGHFITNLADCTKIVGGYETRPHSAPYISHLDRYGTQYFCCGTLIDEIWILSAAHCHYSPEIFQVILGDHDRLVDEGSEQRYQPILAIKHPLYNPTITDNDVMMIKLERPAILNQYVQLAILPTTSTGEGVECMACGWGITDYVGGTLPDALHCVEVYTVTNNDCNVMYGGEVKDSMLCAGGGGSDACNGDSGGPLMCDGQLHGVTSTGFGCAYPYFPGIYARVTEFNSWIESTMSFT